MKHDPIESPRTHHPGYRAEQVAAFVLRHFATHRKAPTYREIMAETGIGSTGEVRRIVVSLERRAIVKRIGRGKERRIGL